MTTTSATIASQLEIRPQERLDMESQFINPKCKKVKLWDNIATKMQQHRYKQNKEKRSKKTGESKITQFFEEKKLTSHAQN
jgi:hypothetical protein